ncbi:MAG: DEAD/DEAH box helicase [Nitrincola lacisaponensis]|uniref:DEAD/DEAH box helicase n=1 Tax=Nitrincola lacisaponensis TaxID=267850 RepID=UPI0039194C12
MHSELVEYFKECYLADNREQGFWDIFSKDNEYLKFVTAEESEKLLNGNFIKPESDYGSQLEAAIETYRREKSFLYANHFVIGKMVLSQGLGGRVRNICAPLFLLDGRLNKEPSTYSIEAGLTTARLNISLFHRLVENRDSTYHLDARIDLDKLIRIQWLEDWLNEQSGNISFSLVKEQEITEKILKNLQRKATTNHFFLVEGGAFLLSKNPVSSRGIEDELTTIAKNTALSAPLKQILINQSGSILKPKRSCLNLVPGILSRAQSLALKNAAEKALSLIIGPPGTGKSYTIACIVLERFMQGESVLVVSENEFAVNVIQTKLVESLGLSSNAIVRAGSRDYLKHLKTTIENLTKGIGIEKPNNSLLKQLEEIQRNIEKDERKFISLYQSAVADGAILDRYTRNGGKRSLLDRFKVWRQRTRLKKYGLLYDRLEKIKDDHRHRETVLSRHINNVYLESIDDVLSHHRQELVRLNRALRARTSARQEAIFSEMNETVLLKALPIWLCSLSSLHRSLPLKSELFDVVIIDEATQCDIASCIPALYRAKKAVVVGDPKQLRHISFLSTTKQNLLQQKMVETGKPGIDLNYRDKSIIDFANDAIMSHHDLVMLDEHYRSLPAIIDFSNRSFYDSNLRIMTEKPSSHKHSPVKIIKVNNAKRVKGINIIEAQAVIDQVNDLIADQQHVPDEFKSTIGILSFFRDQAEKLQELIFDNFDLTQITQHKLRAGTPYSFQGEERDIMLLSCAVDSNTANGTYLYLNRSDVFNVSVTRARHQQWVFFSAELENLPKNNLLRLYLTSIHEFSATNIADQLDRHQCIQELTHALKTLGATVYYNYFIAGIPMDLVASLGNESIAIDLVGFPGEENNTLHLEHYKIFERAGLSILPISYTAWIFARNSILENVKSHFKMLNEKTQRDYSLYRQSSYLLNLFSISPELSKTASELEQDLFNIKCASGMKQLQQLLDSYYKLVWVLNQKLNPNEITFSRYESVAEDVFLGGLENLRKMVLIVQARGVLDGNNVTSAIIFEQDATIKELFEANESAILALEDVALKWSKISPSENSLINTLAESLEELNRLSNSIEHYSAK